MTSVLVWHPEGVEYCRAIARRRPDLDVRLAVDEGEFARLLPEAEILLGFRFPVESLARRKRLRWIQVTSAGAEFLLPLRSELEGVAITNGRGIHGAPIAEYVMAAMTMLQSDFPAFLRAQGQNRWVRRPVETLKGRTIGIMGLGAIGAEIAVRAAAFGMRVLGVTRSASAVPGCTAVRTSADLAQTLAECDFVAVTLPLTEATRGFLDEAAFAAMKDGAYLVNVSRGGVVDERAMTKALASGRLAGACVDVFEVEPLPADSALWSMPNVIVTPHIAGMRSDYVDRLLDLFVANLDAYQRGAPLANVVDLTRGY